MIQPLIKWLVRLQSVKLLCYMYCSLFILLLFFVTILFVGSMRDLAIPLLKILLQGIAIFGGVLFILYSTYYLLKGKRKQKRV
ncbi:hypothetical protein [Virgibacillus halotolerans]|uniref:hypothetical protein n=1 Tax=Virgibacillus halotolerans TaxID=1071053 RepID=UPI00195FDCBC|nr:hypothetical protein [Virgibacillus halotolerans]